MGDLSAQIAEMESQELSAEDQEKLNSVVTHKLTKEGYAVDSCYDGEDAWDYIESTEYDVVLLDITMPEMDGITASHEIRKISAYYENAPIVALTGNASVGAKEELLNAGLNDYLPKPITTIQLEDCIKKWLPSEKLCGMGKM